MKHFNRHIFICTNTRENGEEACGNNSAKELLKYAKNQAVRLNLKEKGIRISSAGCLGNCKEGPVLVIYPEGSWHTYKNEDDIDKILLSLF